MIVLKTPAEIEALRRAGQIAAEALGRAAAALRPGLRTVELDEIVAACFAEHGAAPLLRGAPGPACFLATVCVSINAEVAHGVPGARRIEAGDLVSLDTACRVDGWCADAAWTWPVGPPSSENQRLLTAGRAALERGLEECGRCGRWSAVAAAMEACVREAGCHLVEGVVGHGIGRELHEDPQVPIASAAAGGRADFPLQPGLVLAIEPTVTSGCGRTRRFADGTITTADGRPAAHFEHTVAIAAGGSVVLTAGLA